MASNYPGSLDSFDTIASDKKTSDAVGGRTHRAMHNDLGDAIEAVQTELGTDPSGGSATVKARFEVIEANDWVTSARIAADAVGTSEIAADAVGTSEIAADAVGTTEIADSAVTSAKIADGTIATADIADGAVTYAKLGADVRIGNLLTLNQATGTDTLADTTGFAGVGTSAMVSSTDYAWQGSRSLKVTSAGNYAYAFLNSTAGNNGTMPVTPGDTYTFMVWAKSENSTSQRKAVIQWYQSNGTTAASTASVAGAGAALSTSWQLFQVTGVAPSNAAFACMTLGLVTTTSSGKIWYEDGHSFHRGAGGISALPGQPVIHTGIRPNPANTAEIQLWNDATGAWMTVA